MLYFVYIYLYIFHRIYGFVYKNYLFFCYTFIEGVIKSLLKICQYFFLFPLFRSIFHLYFLYFHYLHQYFNYFHYFHLFPSVISIFIYILRCNLDYLHKHINVIDFSHLNSIELLTLFLFHICIIDLWFEAGFLYIYLIF